MKFEGNDFGWLDQLFMVREQLPLPSLGAMGRDSSAIVSMNVRLLEGLKLGFIRVQEQRKKGHQSFPVLTAH